MAASAFCWGVGWRRRTAKGLLQAWAPAAPRAQLDAAITEYEKAVELQAGYVTAWNNLGDAYETTKQWRCALGKGVRACACVHVCGWGGGEAARLAAASWVTWGGGVADTSPQRGAKPPCRFRPEALRHFRSHALSPPRAAGRPRGVPPCRKALEAYQTVLQYAPNNKTAATRSDYCRGRVERLGL